MDKNKGRRVREVVFTAAGFVILMAIIWYISGSVKKTPLLSEDGMEYVNATKEMAAVRQPVWQEARMLR